MIQKPPESHSQLDSAEGSPVTNSEGPVVDTETKCDFSTNDYGPRKSPNSSVGSQAGTPKIFGIPRCAPSGRGGIGDYREIYPEDPYGTEAGENARVWRVYLDESGQFDDDMVRGFRDTLDVNLVFAALFSAVVTTFVAQTSQALQPNYGRISAALLFELVALQRNTSTSGNITAGLSLDALSYTFGDVLVNTLWFTSLALSLSTVLAAALVKQWIQEYTKTPSGPPRDRVLSRHTQYKALLKWKVPLIINLLPLLLHASLALFLAGLVLFLLQICPPIAYTILPIAGLTYAFYGATHVLAVIYRTCSYRTAVSHALRRTLYPAVHAFRRVYRALARETNLWSTYTERVRSGPTQSVATPLGDVMLDSLKWLAKNCSNPTTVGIAVEAFAGWPTASALGSDDDDDDEWKTGILSALPRLLDDYFDPELPYDEHTCSSLERRLRSVLCITRPPQGTTALYTAWDDLMQRDWTTFWNNVIEKMSEGARTLVWKDQQIVDRLLCLRFIFENRRTRFSGPAYDPITPRVHQPYEVLSAFPTTVRELAMNPQAKLTTTVWYMLLENACRQKPSTFLLPPDHPDGDLVDTSAEASAASEWLENMLYLFRMRITASTSDADKSETWKGVITLQSACARHVHIRELLSTYLRLASKADCWAVALANLVQHMRRSGRPVEDWLGQECHAEASNLTRGCGDRIRPLRDRLARGKVLDISAIQDLATHTKSVLGYVLYLQSSLSMDKELSRLHGRPILAHCLDVLTELLIFATRVTNRGTPHVLLFAVILITDNSLLRRLREENMSHPIIGTYIDASFAIPQQHQGISRSLEAILEATTLRWLIDSCSTTPSMTPILHRLHRHTSEDSIWRQILDDTILDLTRGSAEVGPTDTFTAVERYRRLSSLEGLNHVRNGSRDAPLTNSTLGRPRHIYVTVHWLEERKIWPLEENGARVLGPYAIPFAVLSRQLEGYGARHVDDERPREDMSLLRGETLEPPKGTSCMKVSRTDTSVLGRAGRHVVHGGEAQSRNKSPNPNGASRCDTSRIQIQGVGSSILAQINQMGREKGTLTGHDQEMAIFGANEGGIPSAIL